jgi:hypothetical protein
MENISVADFWFHHVHGNCAQDFSAGCIASDSEMAGVRKNLLFFRLPPTRAWWEWCGMRLKLFVLGIQVIDCEKTCGLICFLLL